MSRRVRIAALVLGSAALLAAAAHARSSARLNGQSAATFWKCADGFNFERNGASQVRCRKPGSEDITYPTTQIQINQGKP